MKKKKLVCFDLDDTLIKDIDSVMIPCILNGKEKEQSIIKAREKSGEIDYVTADYLSVKLFKGLAEYKIKDSFFDAAKPLDNIGHAIDALHAAGFLCIVITVGPKQVAKAVCEIWGLDGYYGSDYETADGIFTGNIITYFSPEDKVKCLADFCEKHGIKFDK